MTDKTVTYADLPLLRSLREEEEIVKRGSMIASLLDRLIAAAEADAPPLPEGWVLLNTERGRRALWHEDGDLYEHEHDMLGGGVWAKVAEVDRRLLTPLRPTIDAETLEKAARAARARLRGADDWDETSEYLRETWYEVAGAAFAAAGFEVSES